MKNNINIESILIYYDTIQLFIGVDSVKTRYLCLLFDNSEVDKYIGIRISQERLSLLLSGNIDLRETYINSEIKNEYIIFIECDETFIEETVIASPLEDMLPEEGVILTQPLDDTEIINERVQLNKPVIHLGLSDENNSHHIKADNLSSILILYQDLVINSHKKLNPKNKKGLDHSLNIFATSAASFNVHMYINSNLDLFGATEIDDTLLFIDSIFNFNSEEELIENLVKIKGYAFSNFKNLLCRLVENNYLLKYKWTTPEIETPIYKSLIPLAKIKRAYEIVNRSSELEVESNAYSGYFIKVDVDSGSWKFYYEDEEKNIIGKCISPNILSGITVETIRYKIYCSETAEQNEITGSLTRSICIDNIEPL